MLPLVMVLAMIGFAAAADDDSAPADDDSGTTFMDSTLDFTSPQAIEASTEYEFIFDVTNKAMPLKADQEKQEWIKKVDLAMPTADYAVNQDALVAPDPLHGDASEGDYRIDHWDVLFNPDTNAITWTAFGVATSVEYGDIREGDVLSFTFKATTDAIPTDGFAWTPYGDMGDNVNGIAYIVEQGDDDDSGPDDDDTGDDDDDTGVDDDNDTSADDDSGHGPTDDDNDSGGGGCGC